MTLTGTYTAAGAALESKISAGLCGLSITRAASAAGPTPDSASALIREKQALPILGTARSGGTFTVRVQLVSASASTAYTLSEIGLYAQDAGTEILYRIYRMDEPLSIDPGTALTAEFHLSESVLAGAAATAVVSPAGLMSEQGCRDVADAYQIWYNDPEAISCTGAQLQTVINGLSRPLSRDVTITVTDTAIPGSLILQNLIGAGALKIAGATSATIAGYLLVQHCSLAEVAFENLTVGARTLFTIPDPVYNATAPKCGVGVRCCRQVRFFNVSITDPSAKDANFGFYSYRSRVSVRDWASGNHIASVCSNHLSEVSVWNAKSNGAAGSSYAVYACDGSLAFVGWDAGTKYGASSAYYTGSGAHIGYNSGNTGNG